MMLTLELFQNTLNELNLPTSDLYIFGDGSGNTIHGPCGWASITWDNICKQYRLNVGGCNHGTNNFAELSPYIHALWVDCYNRMAIPQKITVQIISDSELIVRQGQKFYSRNSNASLWKAIDFFENTDYTISWNHVSRNSNPINQFCDKLAGETRKKFLTV